MTTPDDVRTDADEARADGPEHPRRQRSRGRRIALLCVAGVLLVGVVLAGWAAVEAVRLRSALTSAADDLTQLRDDATSGDLDAAQALLPRAQEHAATADAAAHSVPLRLARALPPVHADLSAVAAMASTAHGLTTDALPPLVDALRVVSPDRLLDDQGRVDIDALAKVAPGVRSADASIVAAQRDLAGLERSRGDLHAPVADAVDRLDRALTSVRAQTRTAARAAALLPPMLGADGPRKYLVMVQNNAEFRSTGGIAGAVLLVEADHGAVSVKEQRSESSLNSPDGTPVGTLTDEENTLFGAQPAVFAQDVNLIPDFPRSGQLLSALWKRATGAQVDGVLSVDPVVLGKVLRATGPVAVAGERLTSANAAQVLLHDIYLKTNDPAAQDAFFAATARAVFDHLLAAGTPKTGVVDALAASAREGRVMVWSAHEDDQKQLTGTVISGDLVGHDGSSPVVGVYLDDGSAAKMSWFVDSTIEVRRTADEIVTTLTLKNTAPAGGKGLPSYMTGGMLTPGDVRTNYDLYAPTGGKVTSVTIDGKKTDVFHATYHGLDVAEWTAELAPGASVTVEAHMSVNPSYSGKPHVRATPAARGQHISVHSDAQK
ncbi:DUF4012 domain-containing protein [Cellulomonas alba]|uniref:DUF4012 domain-containing protein n=1 Tax=Cellulomonas alba TaxID=3053467 RepID=A0ABT7SGY5_9CELL|nr:DUF4012 domain-containing protein [Cellulomonas alba]MDM7855459.1 DUF4012 domain-containing protein [Cellulomonas alba]